jgi:hypothetical protein
LKKEQCDLFESFIPTHILRLLKEGYVVWFHDNYRSRSDSPKQGEQFWIEDSEFCHKTVRMYKSKEITKGSQAQRKFESELSSYSSESNVELTVGNDSFRWINIERMGKSLREELRKRYRIPYLPDTHSYYDIIDDISPTTVISFHKRKIAKIDAFDAKKSKIAVFGWLLKKYPNSVIIPEFGIGGGGWGKTSIVDMAAFDTKRMVFVEIKAENDTYARVAKQLEISALNADEVWLAIYEAKGAPKEIHENIGILSLSSTGKTKILRKAKSFKHSGDWMGHIWSTEWQDTYRSIKGASKWLQHQREGHEGFCNLAASILGKKARQFTIDMWRRRYQTEFFFRRDNYNNGKLDAVHAKRGMNNNDYWEHFKKNYSWNTDQLPSPHMSDFVAFGFTFPEIEKRPTVKSFKQQMLEKKAADDKIRAGEAK